MHMANRVRKFWTFEELESLPDDGNKYELIHGELFVTPPPTNSHETILARITRILDAYVAAHDLGYVYRPRSVIRVTPNTEVEPDLMVRQPSEGLDWHEAPLPILVAEVASDSTRRRDRVHKRGLYTELGIPEYWMIDGDDRTVCVARPDRDDTTTDSQLVWHPEGPEVPLVISLSDIFAPLPSSRQPR